jgi:hypothetical protein
MPCEQVLCTINRMREFVYLYMYMTTRSPGSSYHFGPYTPILHMVPPSLLQTMAGRVAGSDPCIVTTRTRLRIHGNVLDLKVDVGKRLGMRRHLPRARILARPLGTRGRPLASSTSRVAANVDVSHQVHGTKRRACVTGPRVERRRAPGVGVGGSGSHVVGDAASGPVPRRDTPVGPRECVHATRAPVSEGAFVVIRAAPDIVVSRRAAVCAADAVGDRRGREVANVGAGVQGLAVVGVQIPLLVQVDGKEWVLARFGVGRSHLRRPLASRDRPSSGALVSQCI